jgi:hypothetical protein
MVRKILAPFLACLSLLRASVGAMLLYQHGACFAIVATLQVIHLTWGLLGLLGALIYNESPLLV